MMFFLKRNICRASLLFFIFLFFISTEVSAQNNKNNTYSLQIKITGANETLPMAACRIRSIEAFSVSDQNGIAVFDGLKKGEYLLEINYLGFEKYEKNILVDKNTRLDVKLTETSLALNEVSVIAKVNKNSLTTSSIIERQAIDHVQAMSLADIIQLVPGQLFTNTDLTQKSNLQLRSLLSNQNNAFGSSIMVDGVPISTNTDMGSTGSYSSTSFMGADLRQVSTDDIESVEVIRGIASAEYGDMTSGAVIVNTKTGQTPFQVRGKINPSTINTSLGKGFRLGKKSGVINLNADYAQAWSDPRVKTKSFDRYNFGVTYANTFLKNWYTTTSVKYSGLVDWQGNDPDMVADGTSLKTRSANWAINHRGKISINKLFSRTLSYTLSATIRNDNDHQSTIVPNPKGFKPIITATESGYYNVPYEIASYPASGGTESKARNVFAKITNAFFLKNEHTSHHFNMGAEYRYEVNNGRGYYNDNERYPLRSNEDGRPRPYTDIPALNQLSAYLEDNFRWKMGEQQLRVQLGGRFTMLQPGKEEQVQSLSPRFNASFDANKWFRIKTGYGISYKTPGMIHLYPAKKYNDRIAANYIPTNATEEALVMYHTNVYDVKRSKGLKNIKNTKVEFGFEIKLPENRNLGVTFFHDKMHNGFGGASNYYTYTSNFYDASQGLIIVPGQPTTVDWNNPARIDTILASTGKISNTLVSINKGVELDFNLGSIRAIRTAFILSGAYIESESYSSALSISNPSNLPAKYVQTETTPFKLIYPAGMYRSTDKRFNTTLRAVCNIPQLRMVLSVANEFVWYNYSSSMRKSADPLAWIDNNLNTHEITAEMLADENYTIMDVLLSKQRISATDNPPVKYPKTWLLNIRLNKELGKTSGLSFYVNNFLFYEPFKTTSSSTTLSQRNEGSFNFGVELFFNF